MITHHLFKLGPRNLDQRCKLPWLRSLLFWGLIELDKSNWTYFKILFICIAFASLKYLWDRHKHMKTESVPHPKWLHTNILAHSVVSWTVEQSSCIFSVTIAGFLVLDSAIGNGFLMLLQAFAKLYIPHMPKFCMPTFGNGRNNTKTTCICLYRVWFFQHVLGNPVLFLAPT